MGSSNRTSRWLRLGAWIVGGLISLLLLVLVAAGLYTRTAHFEEWVRQQTLALLRASLNGEVSVERISGSIWSEIVFYNLSIRQNDVEVVSVPRGTLTVQLFPQIFTFVSSSTLRVNTLTLTTPVLRLVQHPDTGWNIATLVKPAPEPQEPSTLRLFLDHVGIEQGKIVVQTPTGEETHLTALSIGGELAMLPTGTQVDLSSLTFSLARTGIPAVQWSGGLAYDTTQSPPVLAMRPTDLRTEHSHLQIAGTVSNLSAPTLLLTTDIERLASGDVQLFAPSIPLQQDLSGTVRVTGPLSALQLAATVDAPDGRVTTTTTVNLSQTPPHYEGTLAIERLAIHKVLHLDNLGGEVSGQLSFAGDSLHTGQGGLQAQASGLFVHGQEIGSLVVTGSLTQGHLGLTGEARGPVGEVSWQSQILVGDSLAYEASLTARNIVPAQVTGNPITVPLRLNFDVWTKGSGMSLGEIDATTKLTFLQSQLGSLTNVHGQVIGRLHQQQFTLDTLKLIANDTTLTAQGKLGDLQETPRGTITYTLLSQNLTPWLELLGQQGAGALRLEGNASGTLTALQVEGKATLNNLQIATSTLQSGALTYTFSDVGSATARGKVAATLTRMDAGIRWQTTKVTLTLTGAQPIEVQTDLTGHDEQGRTHRLATEIRYQPERLAVLVKELALQLPTGTWRNAQPARLTLQNQALAIEDFLLQQADRTVSATGTFAWQGPQNLRVRIARLPLADIRTLLGTGPEASGHVSVELQVQGTAAHPEIEMALNTSTITIAKQTYTGLAAQGEYRQQQLAVHALLRQDTTHTLTVDGSIPLSLGWAGGETSPPVLGEADLRVRSTGLSLRFMNLLSPTIQDVEGTLGVNVQVRGPIDALVPSGNIQLQQGQVRVNPLGVTWHDIGAQAEFVPGALQISQFVVRAGDGRLTGSGRLSLQQYTLTAFDLTLNAERFRVITTQQYKAAVSGQLNGSGSLQYPFLQGGLTVEDTTLRPDLSLLKSGPAQPDPTIVVARSEQELKTQVEAQQSQRPAQPDEEGLLNSGPYERLSLDLIVTVPRGTWVYLAEGTLELRGQAQIRKAPHQEAFLAGTIETVRGWYTYYNRKFRLERGRVIFTGASLDDPSLDIVARYTLQKYKIDMVIGGTARAPTLTLRSEPSLEQADILSLILFDRTTDGLNPGEKASLQSQALSATAGYLASDLRRSVGKQLGIDNLEFDVGQTLGQSRIGAGKYLTEDVFVSTSQSLEDKTGREVAIEYQLAENWQLKASTTTAGNDGIDLFWQKRY